MVITQRSHLNTKLYRTSPVFRWLLYKHLILLQIKKLEKENKVDITNKGQHSFKTGKSTKTAGLLVQSLISRALDEDNYVLLASMLYSYTKPTMIWTKEKTGWL